MEKKLIQALNQLCNAMINLNEVWDMLPEDLFDLLCKDYPFEKEFFELTLEVIGWKNDIVEKLTNNHIWEENS